MTLSDISRSCQLETIYAWHTHLTLSTVQPIQNIFSVGSASFAALSSHLQSAFTCCRPFSLSTEVYPVGCTSPELRRTKEKVRQTNRHHHNDERQRRERDDAQTEAAKAERTCRRRRCWTELSKLVVPLVGYRALRCADGERPRTEAASTSGISRNGFYCNGRRGPFPQP